MGNVRIGSGHIVRKRLFQRGLRRGFLTIQEIETALPPGMLTAAERWLLYYSLRAAEIELRDETGALVTVPPLSQEEVDRLAAEREEEATSGTGVHRRDRSAEQPGPDVEEAPVDARH